MGLYEEPERPPNAVDFIKRYLGAPTGVDVEALRTENETLKQTVATLESHIKELNAKVSMVFQSHLKLEFIRSSRNFRSGRKTYKIIINNNYSVFSILTTFL